MSIRRTIFILVLMAILPMSIGGYLYYSSAKIQELKEADNEAINLLKAKANHFDAVIDKYQTLTNSLSGLKPFQQALLFQDKVTLDNANFLLDYFQYTFGVDVCYLMDKGGKTIAASNRHSPQSFVGKNYGFRPYFIAAFQDYSGLYMALGVTSGKRGAYFSQPVYILDEATPAGVVVLKISVEALEKELDLGSQEGIMLLIDPNGVVFMSNREDWDYHTLWKLTPEKISEIQQTRQFGQGPLNWIGMEKRDENLAVDQSGKEFGIYRIKLKKIPGWELICLGDIQSIYKRVSEPVFNTLGVAIIVFVIFILISSGYLYKNASRQISIQKKMEAALRDSEKKFRSVTQSANDAIISANSRGHIIFCNKASEKMFGYAHQDVAGQPLTVIIPEYLKDAHTKGFKRHVSTGESRIVGKVVEVIGRGKNGNEFPVELSLATWKIKEEMFFTAIIRDITERKEMEREREALIDDLKAALAKVKTLSGFLPICAKCKKIRDDKGYWNKIETYIRDHSEAEFSHGICPECAKQLYPEYVD